SQPAFGEFIKLYEKLKEEYDYGIAIHASSELTGTYDSSKNASHQTGFPVEVIDSKIGAYALGKMIRNGVKFEQAGKSYKEIVSIRSEEHTSELQSRFDLVCRLLLEKKKRTSTKLSVA